MLWGEPEKVVYRNDLQKPDHVNRVYSSGTKRVVKAMHSSACQRVINVTALRDECFKEKLFISFRTRDKQVITVEENE